MFYLFLCLAEENRQSKKKSCAERRNLDGYVKKRVYPARISHVKRCKVPLVKVVNQCGKMNACSTGVWLGSLVRLTSLTPV